MNRTYCLYIQKLVQVGALSKIHIMSVYAQYIDTRYLKPPARCKQEKGGSGFGRRESRPTDACSGNIGPQILYNLSQLH